MTFTNEIATICEQVGADAAEVERACAPIRASARAPMCGPGRRSPAARWRATFNFLGLGHGAWPALPVIEGMMDEQPRTRPMGLPAACAAH